MNGLAAFAAEVGTSGAVSVVGGGTQWDVGGPPADGVRQVRAPQGVVAHEPAEMIVRVGAGTALSELQEAVGASGQWVPLEGPPGATVGGLLAVGRSGYRRLRYGPCRDVLLEARFVTADGELARAGAPLVKNVTGFDLCRLLVGSLGTVGLLAEVVVRCLPAPAQRRWWRRRGADPFATFAALFRPGAVLWDGTTTWVNLEGDGAEVRAQADEVLQGWEEEDHPPPPPGPFRRSVAPGRLGQLSGPAGESPGRWLAEVGVGVVHADAPSLGTLDGALGPVTAPDARVRELNESLRRRFDPRGRLNPGRDPLWR